jgi:DedD protein
VEPHVKERIVGAAVLVALGVWLIPLILDGPDETVVDPEPLPEILLPTADEIAPLRTETVELERRASAPSAAEAVAPSPAPEPDPVAATANGSSPVDGRTQTEPAEPEAGSPPPAATAAVLSAPSEPPPARGGWAVQLGAYGEVANASQVANRASTFGYAAVVSEIRSGGQTLHRVRVEGFRGKNEADAAASSLSAHGLPVRVIPPE